MALDAARKQLEQQVEAKGRYEISQPAPAPRLLVSGGGRAKSSRASSRGGGGPAIELSTPVSGEDSRLPSDGDGTLGGYGSLPTTATVLDELLEGPGGFDGMFNEGAGPEISAGF